MSSETTERNAVNTLVDKTFDSLDEDDEDEMIRIIVKRPCRSVCISEGDGEENRSGYGESDDISLSSSLVQDDDVCSSCSDFSLVQRPTKTRTKKMVVVPRSGRSFVPAPTNEGVKSEQTARCSCPLSHVYTPPFEWNRLACDLLVASAETVDARNRGYWEHIALVFQNEYQSHHPVPLQDVEMRCFDSRSRRTCEWNRTPCIGKACRSDAQIVHVLNDLTRFSSGAFPKLCQQQYESMFVKKSSQRQPKGKKSTTNSAETGEKSSSGNSTPVRKARTVFRPNRCDTPDLANVIREKPNQSMGRRAVHELIRRIDAHHRDDIFSSPQATNSSKQQWDSSTLVREQDSENVDPTTLSQQDFSFLDCMSPPVKRAHLIRSLPGSGKTRISTMTPPGKVREEDRKRLRDVMNVTPSRITPTFLGRSVSKIDEEDEIPFLLDTFSDSEHPCVERDEDLASLKSTPRDTAPDTPTALPQYLVKSFRNQYPKNQNFDAYINRVRRRTRASNL